MSEANAWTRKIRVNVNGALYDIEVPCRMTLLELLKERLALTGTKEGCGVGECGACTVIVDGRAVNACLVLAAQVDGMEVRTIEGEAAGGRLSDLQEAFIRHGALQCGFCTPGMIMSARELLERHQKVVEAGVDSRSEHQDPAREEIVEAIAGNLCRCTGYEPIIEAIDSVAKARARQEKKP